MFNDLDATLTVLLNDAPPAELTLLNGADVSFLTPEKAFAPAQTTVNLFLYEVRENRDLRDPTPIVERDGNTFKRRPAPLRSDCSYIVTTWAAAVQGAARVATEHQLLGETLTWLSRFPTVPDRYLQGLLGAPDRIYPPPTMVAQLDPNRHAGDFWAAMGIAPRPAFYLTVTVELSLGAAQPTALPVTTRFTGASVHGTADRPWIQIAGTIVDAAGNGVAGAVADVTDVGLRTRSADDGSYSFPRVPPGAHTIRVVAQGFQPQTQPLVVPDQPAGYRVTLTPLP